MSSPAPPPLFLWGVMRRNPLPFRKEKKHEHLLSQKKIDPPTITRGTVTKLFHGFNRGAPSPVRSYPLHTSQSASNILETTANELSVRDGLQRAALPAYMTNPKNINVHLHHNTIVDGADRRNKIQSPVLTSPMSSPPLRQFVQSVAIDGDHNIRQPLPLVIPQNQYSQITGLIPSRNCASSLGINTNTRNWKSEDNLLISTPVRQENYVAYSNEPMIIGELVPTNHQTSLPTIQCNIDKIATDTTLQMANNQTLNMFLFNQVYTSPQVNTTEHDQQFSPTSNDDDYCGDHEDVVTRHIRMGPERSPPKSVIVPEDQYKQYDIYHKQTQTLNLEPPTDTKIIQTELQEIKMKKEPERKPQQPLIHRETTHYVTKERAIERVHTEGKNIIDCGMQTDYVEPQVMYVDRPLPVYEKRQEVRNSSPLPPSLHLGSPSPPPRFLSPVHIQTPSITNVKSEIYAPPITVIRQVDRKQTLPRSPSPYPIIVPRVSMPMYKELKQEDVPEKESSESSSEESFYEMHEVEEREQRISIAIMEELEFNLQRTQGEKTETLHLTERGLPDKLLGMYETVVDRRRQKSTQIKDIHKGAEQSHQNMGEDRPPIQNESAQLMLPSSMDIEELSQHLGTHEYKSSPHAWKPGHFTDHVNLPSSNKQSRIIHRSEGMRRRNQPTVVNRSAYPQHENISNKDHQQSIPIMYKSGPWGNKSNHIPTRTKSKKRPATITHRSPYPEYESNQDSTMLHNEPLLYNASHGGNSSQNKFSSGRKKHQSLVVERSPYPEYDKNNKNVKRSDQLMYNKKSFGDVMTENIAEYNSPLMNVTITPKIESKMLMDRSSSKKFQVPQFWIDGSSSEGENNERAEVNKMYSGHHTSPSTHASRFYPDDIYFKQAEQGRESEVDIEEIFKKVSLGKLSYEGCKSRVDDWLK